MPSLIALAVVALAPAQLPQAGSPNSAATPPATVTRSATQPQTARDLDEVVIVGRRESGAYYAGDASGSKSMLTMRELPQAVRVLTAQALDDIGAKRVDDTLDYVGGVSRQNNFGGMWDNVAIRGLPGNENTGSALLLNGFSSNRGFNAPRDTANIERIEFLKGPAAALYGSSEPGGTLNIVSKRPRWTSGHALALSIGTHGLRRTTLDTTGPLGAALAYRLNVAWEHRNGPRDHVETQRHLFAPALTWNIGNDTQLSYVGEWLQHRAPLDRGVVSVDGRLGVMDQRTFLGEPGDGSITVRNQTHQVALDHAFNANWRLRAAVAQRGGTLRGFSTEASALRPDGHTLTRQRRYRDYRSDDLALQAEVHGRVMTGDTEHDLLVGVESYRFLLGQTMLRANPTAAAPYAIDILLPQYGQPAPMPGPNTATSERQRGQAFYLQDSLRLGNAWRLLAGLRHDRFLQVVDNHRNGTQVRQSQGAWSPRIGVTRMLSDGWSLYANGGRSYRPNVGTGADARAFAPERANALEFGAKWERGDGRFGATVALFDLRKHNVLTTDPANPAYQIAAGEVRSRGLEMDASGQIGLHLRINASMVYNDVDVLRDNVLETGSALINVPKFNASVLGVYEWSTEKGTAGIGAGLTHGSSRLGENRTLADARSGRAAFVLPAFTTMRLLGYWRFNPSLRASVEIDNLFNTAYFTSSVQRTWVHLGTPRSLSTSLELKF